MISNIEKIGMIVSPFSDEICYQVGFVEKGKDLFENEKTWNSTGSVWVEAKVGWSQVGAISNVNLPKQNKKKEAMKIAVEALKNRGYEFAYLLKQYQNEKDDYIFDLPNKT